MAAEKNETLSYLRHTLLLNFAAAAVVIVLNCLTLGWKQGFSGAAIFKSSVYSFCIGTLISAAVRIYIPRFLSSSAVVRFAQLIAVIFAATFIGVTAANAIFGVFGLSDWSEVFPPRAGTFIFSLLIAFIFGFSTFFYELSQARHARTKEHLRQKELDAALAQSWASEAQLASLESRLHPHFLFNTLNSIAALVREDADLAEKTVERLADLLRYSLDANANWLVELEQETEITIAYLEIERARFGNRLNYEIEIDKQFLSVKVPPFALQTLVENSIKHVAAKRPGAIEIRVSARAANDFLEIEVADDGAGFAARDIRDGHGLDTLRKRSHAIFGDAAQLQIDENADCGRVSFRVPLTIEYEQQRAAEIAAARLFG